MNLKKILKSILPINLEEQYLLYREKVISLEDFNKIIEKHNKKINNQYYHKRTILILASYLKDTAICQILLDHGANPNIQDYKNRTPLHWAVHWGDLDLVKMLVLRGAEITTKDINDRSPIEYAQFHHHYEIFKYFITIQENN